MIKGFYGTNNPCTIFIFEHNGLLWYSVKGSKNVNATYQPLVSGVNVEEISDVDFFTASKEITSFEGLETEVLEFLELEG